ncbi:MAG: hypothetical protein M5U28_42485 [Sandaracinaceae bacterium]|nr:hypothetical protein [Sandaracinaceae bacterium]
MKNAPTRIQRCPRSAARAPPRCRSRPATARADPPEAQAGALEEEALAEGERRPVPDYDGRPARGTDAEDVALWIPRVIFSPLYLVTEYVLRRPIGFVMTELERIGGVRLDLRPVHVRPRSTGGRVPHALLGARLQPPRSASTRTGTASSSTRTASP